MPVKTASTVQTPLGQKQIDTAGTPVGAVKMDVAKAYAGITTLLQQHINDPHSRAWQEIRAKIDYIYGNLDYALVTLDRETDFAAEIQKRVRDGKKVLFKPNLVVPHTLDPVAHGPGIGDTTCTEWPVIAALMRWFHDKLNVTYHDMALGEAASSTSSTAGFFNLHHANGHKITNEAVFEGRSGDFYGGWAFYFIRKYLAECHPHTHKDDPMNGYEESAAGEFIPPGKAGNRLMVYDLNRINTKSKGRTVPVPDCANFKEITLHKVIIGGDPGDAKDMADYPGCVLINVPKLKIHAQDLITNAIKNLGIGLYPQEAPAEDGPGNTHWKYAYPFHHIPGMKTEIPHMPWVAQMQDGTMLPQRDESGNYVLRKTRGFPGTQADIIRATQNQGIYMLHVVDGIEAINISHTGQGMGMRVNEGFVWASTDVVALDTCCARYCFKTVLMAEARELQARDHLPTDFMHRVPVAKVEGKNIVSVEDVDSPLFRYHLYEYCEKRGVGKQAYHVTGWDTTTGEPLASVEGHLGRVNAGTFTEVTTGEMYYNPVTMLWDMQKTVLSYARAHDQLNGTTLYNDIMAAYDENGDGVIEYDEAGRKGHWSSLMRVGAWSVHIRATEKYGFLKGSFISRAYGMRYSNPDYNEYRHDFMREYRQVALTALAFQASRMPIELPDSFVPAMTIGSGKWPSWQFVNFMAQGSSVYGMGYPMRIDALSMYSSAFQYADKTQNGGAYTGSTGTVTDAESQNRYVQAVRDGSEPLDFTLYVPAGLGTLGIQSVPNVEETADPAKMFTASFRGGKEVWKV